MYIILALAIWVLVKTSNYDTEMELYSMVFHLC